MIRKGHFFGNHYVGLFSVANDKVALSPKEDTGKFERLLKETLDVEVKKASIADSPILGIYAAISNAGIVLPELTTEEEAKYLAELFDIVYVSGEPLNAWGNNLVMTTKGAIINPDMEEEGKHIEDVFGIEVVPMKIAGYKTVGSAVVATEKGFITSYKANDDEIKRIEEILHVRGRRASTNMGSALPSIGIVANSKGAIVGELTTGVELAYIEEGLDLI